MPTSPKGSDVSNKFENIDVLPPLHNIIELDSIRLLPNTRRKRAESFSCGSQELEKKQIHKMKFIWNALEQGWTIKKKGGQFIFTRKHENKTEVFRDNYLENFLVSNFTKETEN